MAGYLGYALKAGVEGFQTGMNIAQQKQEMEWQKKQRKKLEEKEAKLAEEAAAYNLLVKQLSADGSLSEDDVFKLTTTYLAFGYYTQERLKGAHDALLTMDTTAFDREIGWFDRTIDLLGSGLLDPKDATAVFEYGRENWATSEKVRNLYTAADKVYAKQHEIAEEERVYKRAEIIPSERRVPFIEKELGIEMPEAEVTPKAPSVAQQKFDWATEAHIKWLVNPEDPEGINFEEYKKYMGVSVTPEKSTGLEKQIQDIRTEGERAGIDPAEITKAIQDKILGKERVTTPTAFKTLQTIKDSFKNVKTRAEYDEALASYNASKEAKTSDWTPPAFEGQLTDLIKRVESALWSDYVDKDGRLKSKIEAEEYNAKLQHYLRLIEEARNAGIDVNMFQAFIPYKATFAGLGNPLVTAESW